MVSKSGKCKISDKRKAQALPPETNDRRTSYESERIIYDKGSADWSRTSTRFLVCAKEEEQREGKKKKKKQRALKNENNCCCTEITMWDKKVVRNTEWNETHAVNLLHL